MSFQWDLTDLFSGNDDFYNEFKIVEESLNNIERFTKISLDENSLLEMLDNKWCIKEKTNNILVYGSLKYYKSIKSDECIKLKSDAEKFSNEVDLRLGFVDRKILELGRDKINSYISKNPKLRVYELYLDNLFRRTEHIQNDEVSTIIKNNNDSINSLLESYNNMLRDMKYGEILIGDKEIEITPSNIVKYLTSRDRETREKVYLLVYGRLDEEKEAFAGVLDNILGLRNKNSQLEKYDSVLEKVLFEENIDIKIIDTLINTVDNNLYLIQKYLKMKADLLGIDEPHLYDFGVPLDNNVNKTYSLDDAINIIINALEPLGEDYLKAVHFLLDGHIDAEANDDKHQSITFSWNVYSFMNFRGTYNDLKNMIHELGHIVNYYFSKKNLPFIYEDSTIFVGETASLVNEFLLNRYLYSNASSEDEKIFYLSKEIENYFTTVFKQTMYTEFEKELYSLKESRDLNAEILSECYEKLIKRYYGDGVVYDDVAGVEWLRLGHLYRWSYYPYKYATGLIIASVVVDSLLDKKTLSKEKYIKFLSSGSSMYSLELLKILNVDLTNLNIIENGFNVMKDDIEKLEELLSKKNGE